MSDTRAIAFRDGRQPGDALRLDTGGTFLSTLSVAALTALVGWLLIQHAGWQAIHIAAALAGFVVLGSIVNVAWLRHMGNSRFGGANQATLLRAGLVCLIGSALLASGQASILSWYLACLISFALALDAVDGFLARRFRLASAFGARFDMEIDALLLLILSLLVWQTERVGGWVLAIGLMRYGFVVASHFHPALRKSLPPSFRRKSVCALQGIALLACLVPPLGHTSAMLIAALALAALIWSFGIDVLLLLRMDHKRPTPVVAADTASHGS
jgi:phosphatidylglycerophosphate synthase